MELYLIVAFLWSMIFNIIFICHVVHCKRNEIRFNRTLLFLNIFFALFWVLPSLWMIALLFALSSGVGFTSM